MNTNSKRFTFTQKHCSGFIQRGLVYINFEYSSKIYNHDRDTNSCFNIPFSSTLLVFKRKSAIRGKGFWKFISSLTKVQNYIIEIKKLIGIFCSENKPQTPIKM